MILGVSVRWIEGRDGDSKVTGVGFDGVLQAACHLKYIKIIININSLSTA